jgi:hypothetical protein
MAAMTTRCRHRVARVPSLRPMNDQFRFSLSCVINLLIVHSVVTWGESVFINIEFDLGLIIN